MNILFAVVGLSLIVFSCEGCLTRPPPVTTTTAPPPTTTSAQYQCPIGGLKSKGVTCRGGLLKILAANNVLDCSK